MSKMIPIEIGQIRVTANNRKSIIPYAEGITLNPDGNEGGLSAYLLLFSSSRKKHYIVIAGKVNPTPFYLVHLLSTKSLDHGYDNVVVKKEWVQDRFFWKPETRITKQTFLVKEEDIKPDYEYGYFDLFSLHIHLESQGTECPKI